MTTPLVGSHLLTFNGLDRESGLKVLIRMIEGLGWPVREIHDWDSQDQGLKIYTARGPVIVTVSEEPVYDYGLSPDDDRYDWPIGYHLVATARVAGRTINGDLFLRMVGA